MSQLLIGHTDLNDKRKVSQVTLSKEKYQNAEYDDKTVECLMKYFEVLYVTSNMTVKNTHR
jgi:hypothetical protein